MSQICRPYAHLSISRIRKQAILIEQVFRQIILVSYNPEYNQRQKMPIYCGGKELSRCFRENATFVQESTHRE